MSRATVRVVYVDALHVACVAAPHLEVAAATARTAGREKGITAKTAIPADDLRPLEPDEELCALRRGSSAHDPEDEAHRFLGDAGGCTDHDPEPVHPGRFVVGGGIQGGVQQALNDTGFVHRVMMVGEHRESERVSFPPMPFDYRTATGDSVRRDAEAAVDRAESLVDAALTGPPTFDSVIRPLDEVAADLQVAYGRGPFLGNVHTDISVRDAARKAEAMIQKWQVELVFRDDLYAAVRAYAATDEAAGLRGESRRLLDFLLRDLRRAGHELNSDDRAEVRRLRERLVELEIDFQKNIAEYEDHLEVAPEDLAGLPADYREGLAPGEREGSYRVTMAYPHVVPFMENAERRDLREALSFKFSSRAVAANRPILEEAVRLRDRIAALFGAPSWAHYQMEEKMARNPEAVAAFYDELIPPLTARGTAEVEVMTEMLAEDTGADELRTWDWRYYDTQLRKSQYGVDNNAVAEYFPLEATLDGLLDITGEVFGLTYRPRRDIRGWHDEAVLYEILDAASGKSLAFFWADLFPREGKYNHAAAFPLVPGRRLKVGSYVRPVSAIVANFTRPTAERPSLLQHNEVETLFHEFGHVLHMSLTTAEFTRFAGTGTEWDFVEAPSQIMEEWCWRADVLSRFGRHYKTGEPIPTELVDQLVRARRLNIALHTLRQVSFGVFDMGLHGPGDHSDLDALHEAAEAVGLLPPHEGTFFPASFGHLLGGYDAGYYGYLWSQVYGLDMFSRFEEEGVMNPEVGMRYRREILEKGGTLDGEQLLRNFLGREPSNAAFLRLLGIA